MIQQEKGRLLFIKTVYQTDNEKRLSNKSLFNDFTPISSSNNDSDRGDFFFSGHVRQPLPLSKSSKIYLFIRRLIVFLLHLEVSLRMQTCRTNFGSFFTYSDVTAITTLPYHFAFFSEYSHIFDVVHESQISFFVTFFCDGDIAVHSSNHWETFLFCHISKVRIIQ